MTGLESGTPARDRRVGAVRPQARRARGALARLAALAALAGCASRGGLPPGGETIAPGARDSARPPAITVIYPPRDARLTASDSTFIFGSVSPAGARVSVNGVPAGQAAGGGWLAWVPIAPGEFVFHVEARSPGAVAAGSGQARVERAPGELVSGTAPAGVGRLDWPVRVPGAFLPSWKGVVDTASVVPRQRMELHPGDPIELGFRGAPGLRARALLLAGSGDSLAAAIFVERAAAESNDGRRVFGGAEPAPADPSPTSKPQAQPGWSWYRAELVLPEPAGGRYPSREDRARPSESAAPACPTAGPCPPAYGLAIQVDGPAGGGRYPIAGAEVLALDPAALEPVLLNDDPLGEGRTDGTVVGRTAPDGVYFLFFPDGTRAAGDRRIGDFLEVRLDDDLSAWVPLSEASPLPEGTPRPRSRVPVVRTRRLGDWTRISVPLEEPLPVQVRQQADPVRYQVTIFGARAATEFLRYDFGDPLVREIRWSQPASERFVLDLELDQRQPWGYRYGYEGADFFLDVRRSPPLSSGLFGSILKGLKIVVDPGHSPDSGATGPTGFQEKEANLLVAHELARELGDAGADVVMTRFGEAPEGATLNDRTNLAAREEADLLVSVHHNALPDGVNPFLGSGSSTYYYQPQSLPLARAIQAELLKELGLPDFGVALGNLALVRSTGMPAVLTEAAFMMLPEQEELLRTEAFRKREARAIRKGIERFLEEARQANREEKR